MTFDNGIASQAFVETGDKTMMILMAKEAVLKQGEDGRLAVIGFANGINDSATTLEGCLTHIRPDHLFHNNINEPDTFVETSLSARLAWTIFTGIQQGWLEDKYMETALDMRKAVYGKVDEYGNVNGVPGSPSYSFPGRSVEGQAFFLMMEAAYDKLNHISGR